MDGLTQGNVLEAGAYGKLTFPELLGINPWPLIVPLSLVLLGFLRWLDRKGM